MLTWQMPLIPVIVPDCAKPNRSGIIIVGEGDIAPRTSGNSSRRLAWIAPRFGNGVPGSSHIFPPLVLQSEFAVDLSERDRSSSGSLCPAKRAQTGQNRNAHLCSEARHAIFEGPALLGRFSHEELATLCASGPQHTNDAVCAHCSSTSHGNEWLGSSWLVAAHPPGLHRPATPGASGPHSRGLGCWQARHQ